MARKKFTLIIIFCAISLFALISCTSRKTNNTNSSNNKSAKKIVTENTTPKEDSSRKSNAESDAEKQAAEKKAVLDKKAQDGYDLFFHKKYNEAITIEDSIIKEDPTFYKAYYIKGITLCYSGNYDEGSKTIDMALKLNPDDYMCRFNKALSLELFAHYDEAIDWYNKALEIQKGEWSYYGISSIYGRRGDVINTVKYLKLAIDINPGIKEEAKNEADFNPVKNSKEFIDTIK